MKTQIHIRELSKSNPKWMLKILKPFSFILFILFLSSAFGQAIGDYRTNATGTWNWSNAANWQRCVTAGTWVGATSTSYPGQNPGAGSVTILNNTVVTLDVTPANNIGALTINNGANHSGIVISGANSLVVNNATTITSNTNNINKYIDVADGSFTTGSLTLTGGGGTQDAYIKINTGTATVVGNITMTNNNANRNYVWFSGSGTLFIGGSFTSANAYITSDQAGTAVTNGTVNFNGTGAQTIPAMTYYNLTLSNAHTANNITLVNGGTINVLNTFTPSATFTSGGYINTGNTINFNGTGNQTIPAFNYNNLTISSARTVNSVTLANSGIIGIAATFTNSATFTTGGYVVTGSTVDFNGDAAQNIPAFTFNNLTASNINSASVTARTKTLTGNVTVNGDLIVDGNTASATVALQLSTLNLSVTGTSNINGYGILNDNSATGTNLFVGRVYVNANGAWTTTNNPAFTFRGGLTYDGSSFTSGTGTYTFNTNAQTIEGSQAFAITNLATGTVGVTVTNRSTVGLSVGTLSGTGNFTNGDVGYNSILNLTGTGNPLTLTGTVDFAINQNTVNYNATTAQTIAGVGNTNIGFYDLTTSGARANNSITLVNAATISIKGNFNANATFTGGAYVVTNNTVHFNGTIAQNIPYIKSTYNIVTVSGGSTKTLTGNVTTSTLNLEGAVVELDVYNLIVSSWSSAAISTTSSFGATNMISTSGSGYLQKNGNTSAAQFILTYPVGSGGNYTPMTLNSCGVPVAGSYLRVRTVASAINPSYINRYWSVTVNNIPANYTATFNYAASELNGAAQSISYSPDYGTNWQNPPSSGTSSFPANAFRITNGNSLNGYWTMGYRTYYSYQSGDWDVPSTWTSDPSGTLQIGTSVPSSNDFVYILTGRTVSLPSNISSTNITLNINSGAILDMKGFQFDFILKVLNGQGTLKLSSANFPTATTNTFVNAGGGTTEYYNTSDFNLLASQSTYNNLTINIGVANTATQMNNLTINGSFRVQQGIFRINDDVSTTVKNLTINGDVTVDLGASIIVGKGATNTTTNPLFNGLNGGTAPYYDYYEQFHNVKFYGNFTNEGTVKFTNLAYPVYNALPSTVSGANTGAATVYFLGSTDNTLTCDGTTDFYNLVVDKGTDQTYKLIISSTSYTNFRIFGANTADADGTSSNPFIKKALWIKTGTLVLQGSCVIPSLTEGNTGATTTSDYYLPTKSALELDGTGVVVLVTADDYREVNVSYGVAAPDNASMGIIIGGYSAFKLFGKLQVNSGYFSTRESAGIITDMSNPSIGSGQLIISGGNVDAKQFYSFTSTAAYNQSGGVFILRGRLQRNLTTITSMTHITSTSITYLNYSRALNGINANYGSFSLSNVSNVFTMSGGVIRIYDICGDGTSTAQQKAFDVLSSSANYNVTGGTVEFRAANGTVLPNTTDFLVTTKAPLGNVLVQRTTNPSPVIQLNTYPLVVLNNMNITTGAFNANSLNLTVGGNFTIAATTTYTTGSNTTILNGIYDQTFTVNLAAALSLNKFKIDKPSGIAVNFAGTQKTINVLDSMWLYLGTLNDNGNTINVARDIYNSGVHTSIVTPGNIVLNGTLAQTIDGDGTFYGLQLNNTNAAAAPVTLLANIKINGALTLSNDKLFNIGIYNVYLGNSASIVGASSSRYLKSAGNAGDGGVTKVYSATATSFTFPLGVNNYTPSTLSFGAAPTTWGSVTVIPVNYEHPNVTTTGRSLTYYWRVKSSGFTLGSAQITHRYDYASANEVSGGDISTNGYIAARFYNNSWSTGTTDDVDETSRIIGEPGTGTFLEGVNFIEGDYTCGDNVPTDPFGVPTIYYSRQSGLWSDVNTWSLTGHSGGAATGVPSARDIVIIGGQDSVYLSNESFPLPDNNNPAVSYYQLNKAFVNCASLQIEVGSCIDIQNNPGCTFSVVKTHPNGNGNFRITTRDPASFDNTYTFVFPSGDFSEYNTNRGTTEFYTINPQSGTVFIMPTNANTYGNVILSPLRGSNLILPNLSNVTINGSLYTRGSDADAWFAMSWVDALYGAIISKTVYVKGDMHIQGGSFGFIDNANVSQTIKVDGDVVVYPNAAIDVWTWLSTSINNTFTIGGSLINNTNNSIAPNGSPSLVRFYNSANSLCTVNFTGSNSASITNTGTTPATGSTPTTRFGIVNINKGTNKDSTLTCNINGTLSFAFTDSWLTLYNGTFIYNTNVVDLPISTNTPFTIPSTAGLTLNTTMDVNISNANSNTNDLYLDGKFTLINGRVFLGRETGNDGRNCDIEYSGGGNSEIEIQGGTLLVNGQIRRSTTSTNGILKYTQSGGTLVINGQNHDATRAKLEIVNTGSSFNMSGGTISIVRGGGTTFGDLYLRPENSTVTGGTILLSQVPASTWPTVDAVQTYTLDASATLYNLTITGKSAATTRTATVGLSVNPLVLLGGLTLTNAQSILNSNNLNVTIGGHLTNNGTYNYGTNTTTFNGGTQNILGTTVTNFYDLVVNPISSLTPNNSFTVNRDLFIYSGNLALTNITLNLKRDIENNSAYTDDNIVGGGVILNGTAQHQISGTGSFGRLELNNALGAITNNSITLQNNLVLTLGVLNIGPYLLTLNQNALIDGAPFDVTKMIKSDGVRSSLGVRKYFNAILNPATMTFEFPIGVSGKYTPGIFNISNSATVGYIQVNPVNTNHSAVYDPTKVLNYYWEVESSGISDFSGRLDLYYLESDVNGVETDYLTARLELPGNYWDKHDSVDVALNQIAFYYDNSSNLNGDYTAGDGFIIPDEVPTYISNSNGNWSDNTKWDPVGAAPPCPVGGPNGFNVIVDHDITTDANNCLAYSTVINGKLKVVTPYFGHDFGTITGEGTLYIDNVNLPAGDYATFFDCAGNSTLEFSGTASNYTMITGNYSRFPNLLISGTGSRILPSFDITVCKRLIINNSVVTLDQSINNKKIIVMGTFERGTSGIFKRGTGNNATVSFAGNSAQSIDGIFTSTNGFNNMEINNSHGLTIGAGQIAVNGNLLLTNGLINTSGTANRLYLSANTQAVPINGNSNSYINGALIKNIRNGENFLFPLGKDTVKAHDFKIYSNTNANWMVEFFTPNPTYTQAAPTTIVNKKELWKVRTYITAAATGLIRIDWDAQSELNPLMTQDGVVDMILAEYSNNSNLWEERESNPFGTSTSGYVVYDDDLAALNFTTADSSFTTAAYSPVKPLAKFNNTSGYVCGSNGIPITFVTYSAISLPYTLYYTVNGGPVQTETVNSLPYTLPTASAGAYLLTGFKYNGGANTGVVTSAVVNVFAQPTSPDAGVDTSLCGLSGLNLYGSDPGAYSGLWSIESGSGGVLLTPTSKNSYFNGILGSDYVLRWTISNGSCTSYDEVNVSFPIPPARPSEFTASVTPVCLGSFGNVYTVPNSAGVTYNWNYTGTGETIHGTSNSVTIDFNEIATVGVLQVTASNGCGTSIAREKAITFNPIPVLTISSDDADNIVCTSSPSITFTATPGVGPVITNYNFKVNGTSVQSGASNTYNTALLNNNDTVFVIASTAIGCSDTSNAIVVRVVGSLWTGTVDNDWFNPVNWGCGGVPTNTTDVAIQSSPLPAFMPEINAVGAECKNMFIPTGTSISTIGSNNLDVYGDWTNNGTFNANSGSLTFRGAIAQNINGSSANNFNSLILNTSGLTLNSPVQLTGALTLTNGIINTSATNLLTLTATASTNEGTNSTHVNGPMCKIGNTAFKYPIGKSGLYCPIQIEASTDINNSITAVYLRAAPSNNVLGSMNGLDHVSYIESWDLTRNAGTEYPAITLFWKGGVNSWITDVTDLRIAHWNSATSKWDDMGGVGVGSSGGGFITSTVPFTSYSPQTFGSKTGPNPLPVELIEFDGVFVDNKVFLKWATASEINNSHFIIQRSENGRDFEELSNVKAVGNSTQFNYYASEDTNPFEGNNYYRLKQVDFDGKFTISKTILIKNKIEKSFDYLVYPNPVEKGGTLIVSIYNVEQNDKIEISVIDMNGKVNSVHRFIQRNKKLEQMSIPLSLNLEKGVYIIKVVLNSRIINKKIIVN